MDEKDFRGRCPEMKKVTYITLKVLAMPDPFSPGEGLTISKDVEHFPAFDRQLS